jgi:hypothetical protein
VRASDRERDAVVQRVQQAFAEGRLDDGEFDERMRAALTARTHADLDVLLADLPAETGTPGPAPVVAGRGPGRLAIALKSSVRRAGRWRVPDRYTTVVYKGSGWLDLRAAELSGPVTTFLTVAYKSRVTILVPPGVRVEMTGFGVTQGEDEDDPGYRLPTDAPVIHVPGVAYKGAVEITTRPPERPALRADRAGEAGSAQPGPGLAAPDVVRRLVERRIPELSVAGLAGHQQVPHAPAALGSLLRRRADTGFPADPGLARPQRMAERAALRLVLEEGHRHEMIMPVPLVLALVRRKDLTRSGPAVTSARFGSSVL